MPTASLEYLNQLDAFLIVRGLRANRNTLLESKGVHYLMFHGMNRDAKRPPVSIRLASDRDDPLELARFLNIKPADTKFGIASMVFIQGAETAGLHETSKLISTVFDTRTPGGQVIGVEWIGEWLVFNPAKRLRELEEYLKIRANDLLAQSAPTPVFCHAQSPDRPQEMAEQKLAHTSSASHRKSGLKFEDELAEEMSQRGIAFASNKWLDRHNKTDFLILHCDGITEMRPIALQVTLRWDDMLKMRAFRNSNHGLRVKKRWARFVYLQIREDVTPSHVANIIREVAALHCASGAGGKVLFVEIDRQGWRTFVPEQRLQHLSRMANPNLTKSSRAIGTVIEVKANGLRIQGDGTFKSKTFWSFISEIADERLLTMFRNHNDGLRDICGLRVSLIPEAKRSQGDHRAKSVILAE